jgi:PAS domain S-box-containing protein
VGQPEAFYRGQCAILARVVNSAPLPESLVEIVQLIEQFGENMWCTILLVDEGGTHIRNGAAPSLPAEYVRELGNQPIGPKAGSCGAAAFLKHAVIVDDIATHPNWVDYRDLALRHGLRACWSTPIISDDKVLGTFAMYYREPRGPSDDDRRLVDAATQLAAMAIVHDTTTRALREGEARAVSVANALRKSEERLRAVIEHTPNVAIQWYDDDGRITFCNRASLRMYGWNASAVIGKTLREIGFFSPAEDERFARTRALAASGTSAPTNEFSYRRGDGSQGVVLSTVFQIPFGTNESCVVCMDVDITELRQSEADRHALESQLQQNQRLQSLGTLASGIAHDFNNILAAISSNAALAAEPELPIDEVRACITDIQAATQRATKLVRQILQFARKQDARKELADMRPVIEEAVALVARAITSRVKVHMHFPSEPIQTMFDATQLHQIVVNLVTNAVHAKADTVDITLAPYTHTGRPMLDLPEGHYLRLSIEDTGVGMDEATLARIFDPFFTTKPASEGTGLGLSIVHEIVRGHGGAITVRSQLGKGTTFSVYFPHIQGEQVATTPGRGERILLVDDEDAMVFLGTRLLTKLGYRVVGRSNPNRALEEFRADPKAFDAVIADLAMPGLSGVALLDEVLRVRPDISVILTSGYARPEDMETARAHNFGELIPKPHTADEFAWAVSQRLQEKRRAR